MSAELSEEHRMVQDLVAKFVDKELMPLEPKVLAREMKGEHPLLTKEELDPLLAKCKELGLWGLDSPEEFGGADLPAVTLMAVNEELGRTIVPFMFPPDSPNLHILSAVATPEQRTKYLEPYARGEAMTCMALSEPGAGADPGGMTTKAERIGEEWVINGRKTWISWVPESSFYIVMARVGGGKRQEGITAFLIDKGTKGLTIERAIPMIGGHVTYELVFEDMRVPATALLGEVGKGFAPMQLRLNVRRLQIAAWAVGLSRRALDMMTRHAKQRSTFGSLLADRQTIQWWIADSAIKIHASRLMIHDAAARLDRGEDVRESAAMCKIYAAEIVGEIVDCAVQTFGAMGVAKEMPLQFMTQKARLMRIYEGPSEVHRMSLAKRMLAAIK